MTLNYPLLQSPRAKTDIGIPTVYHRSHFLLATTNSWGKGFKETGSVHVKGKNLSGLWKNFVICVSLMLKTHVPVGRCLRQACGLLGSFPLRCGGVEVKTSGFLGTCPEGRQAPSLVTQVEETLDFLPIFLNLQYSCCVYNDGNESRCPTLRGSLYRVAICPTNAAFNKWKYGLFFPSPPTPVRSFRDTLSVASQLEKQQLFHFLLPFLFSHHLNHHLFLLA